MKFCVWPDNSTIERRLSLVNSHIKILLADESAVFLEQLRHVLERDPAFVIAGSANDAQRAVELLHRTQPDILILDLLLP